MKKKDLMPFNLQFFAEGGDDNGEGNGEGSQGEKTFTQSQVNGMMAKEKNEGKRSILKSLGFDKEEDALAAIKELETFRNSKKTQDELNKEELGKTKDALGKANERAIAAENKLTCISNGVDTDCVDDILAIAKSKVTDEKSLEDVVKEMKEDSRYKSFFTNPKAKSGTGSTPGHSGNNDDNESDNGKRLAEMRNASKKETKNSYFG